MTTLHALRRSRNLSLGELARLTGIPLRRLAEFEYEERPLKWSEREAIAAVFDTAVLNIAGGVGQAVSVPEGGRLTQHQVYLLSAVAAAAALSLSLQSVVPELSAGVRLAPAVRAAADPTPSAAPSETPQPATGRGNTLLLAASSTPPVIATAT